MYRRLLPASVRKSACPLSILRLAIMGLATAGWLANAAADEALQASEQFFESSIRPVLHSQCVKCHGENKQEGNLRLDSLEGLLKGGDSGPAIVVGKPQESLLMEAVRYESFEMPPVKPLKDEQISDLEKWIAGGAAWPVVDGQSVRLQGAAFTPEELQFWSLQPIHEPQVPKTDATWVQNDIDRFVAARLDAAGINAAPRATASELTRRVCFDLLGVPPEPLDLQSLSAEGDFNQNWAALVDRLLADTRYGEHWARYWLDVVRYAESDGFRADGYRADAWRYRDYVINAFNADKPYDQFVKEQLAGDEIAPQKAEALVATGFLRTYLYEYNQRDARTQRQDILNQITDLTGEVFLGMGVGCARCHDHKFDPILQADYYRLQACFASIVPRDDVPAADLVDRQRYDQQYQEWLAKGADVRQQLAELRKPYLERAARSAITKFPEDIQAIMAKDEADRTALELQLADLVNRQILFEEERIKYKGDDKTKYDELQKQLQEIAGNEPARLPTAITVSDLGQKAAVIHLGANPERATVEPGGFTIISSDPFAPQPLDGSTGRRTALAEWLVNPDNPLPARVIVNRIWQHHFGKGLVETASDFGSLGGKPTHPELLDWLAVNFVKNGWSIKWLHRQILGSATWQMSSFHPDASAAEAADPGNDLRWRFDVKRLSAEQIRDAMLVASGELLSEQGGSSADYSSLRRSLYLKAIRNRPEPLLTALDGVDGLNSTPIRSVTTTPTQALQLMNGEWVRKRATAMAQRVQDEAQSDAMEDLIEHAFVLAYGRKPAAEELSIAMQLQSDLQQAAADAMQKQLAERFPDGLTATGHSAAVASEGTLTPLAVTGASPKLVAPFTFAGIIRLDSLYPDATVRTIVSQWDSNNKNNGWAIGVTSEKSGYKPRNFILQVVGEQGYEVVASNLRPELGKAYFAAVSVQSTAEGKGLAEFFLQPLDGGELQTAKVEFKSAAGLSNDFPVIIGGRHKQSRHRWDGQLDQVALFAAPVSQETITGLFDASLTSDSIAEHSPAAFWDFEQQEDGHLADGSGHGHSLTGDSLSGTSPLDQSLADLCHVLLNSNEFVYID